MNREDLILIPEELAIKKPKKELLKIINEKTFNDKVLFELASDFHDIKIVENEVGKFLHYQDTYQAGFINTDFYKGNLPYINYFLIPYLMNKKIENILLIGLGSGKIVTQFETLFDNLKSIDVVDLEENIVDIAQNYFDFNPSQKFNFILQDGLTTLGYNTGGLDGVFGSKTKNSVIEFQRRNNLIQDGLVGTNTWNCLQNQVVGNGPTSTTIIEN